jgi:CheY-like chemotaxis protein
VNERSTRPSPLWAFTSDLFLIARLEDAAAALGFRLEIRAERAEADDSLARPVDLTEPLEGEEGALVRELVQDPPALILVDLSHPNRSWQRWIHVIKTSSATRRFPILAFGPHVDSEALELARALGADRVVTRGQLQARLAEILQEAARPPDLAAIAEGCALPPSDAAVRGIAALRRGAYFEAHEHLEHAILGEPGPEGSVYRCLLHLAVALLHTERGNWRGAQKMLLRMRPWLASLPAACRGVDVSQLRTALDDLQARLDRWRGEGGPPGPVHPPVLSPPGG